jgi:hypothetical protein
VTTLGDALAYAHQSGVVHGDLKPSAVLFDTREQPYLTDFSQARGGAGKGTETRAVFGTPAYMAPEQWRGEATPASDQFALAAVTYYVLTGSPPFEGQEHPRIRRRNFELGPEPAHEEAARNTREPIPATVSETLRRALQADASARFPSVAAFTRAFSDALRGVGAAAPQPRPGGPRGFWVKLRAYFARPQVFLSYHRASSSGWADLIEMRMTGRHRIDVFLDRHRLDAAGAFPAILEREIESCDVFVCLLGAATIEQKWVRHEIEHAIKCGRPMIPVFCEGFKRPDAGREDPTIQCLIEQDGINLYGEHSLEDIRRLARMVKNTFRGRQRRARAAGHSGS